MGNEANKIRELSLKVRHNLTTYTH